MQCIDGLSLLLQSYVRKGDDAKNPAILSFCFVTARTQLTHWRLNEIARDPPLIPWRFLDYFTASETKKNKPYVQ